jgi:hypothetical protein
VNTDVSYEDDIRQTIVANLNCINCHTSHTPEMIKDAFKNLACITNNLDINDCSPSTNLNSMSGITLTQQELDLILLWQSDGKED